MSESVDQHAYDQDNNKDAHFLPTLTQLQHVQA